MHWYLYFIMYTFCWWHSNKWYFFDYLLLECKCDNCVFFGWVSLLHEGTLLHEVTLLHEGTLLHEDTFARRHSCTRWHFCTATLLHERHFSTRGLICTATFLHNKIFSRQHFCTAILFVDDVSNRVSLRRLGRCVMLRLTRKRIC